MVNHISPRLRIRFGAGLRIPLREVSGFLVTGFRILIRGLANFLVIPGLLVPTHPPPVPVFQSFEFSMPFVVGFKHLGRIFLLCHIGWCFVT